MLVRVSPSPLLLSLGLAVTAPAALAAVLEGTVLDNSTSRPLARCEVGLATLQNGYEVPLKPTLTDSGGRFRFDALQAGTYFLTARRNGYQPARYGQKRWDGAGSSIVLAADGQFFAEFRLQRSGAVSGTVLDENRIGLPGNTVTAYEAGAPPLRIAGSAVSDDRGVFRIAGLQPGAYYVRTGPQTLEDGRGLLPTFFGYPETKPVFVELDRETGQIDIQPEAGSLGYLRGRFSGGAMAAVWLFSETGTRQTTPGAGGEFTIDQLAPGDYELIAQDAMGSSVAYRKLRIRSGANEVTLAPAGKPLVRIRIEEGDAKPVDPMRVTVSLTRKGFSERLPVAQPVPMLSGAGALQVMPGEYAAVVQTSREYYVRSVRAQDSRDPNTIEALPGAATDLLIVLGSRPGTLSGKVTVAGGQTVAGAMVFLDPLTAELRTRLGGTRVVRADGAGAYRFEGLPPGDYQVFSSFEFQNPQESDFKRVPVKVVSLQEGAQATVDLELFGSL